MQLWNIFDTPGGEKRATLRMVKPMEINYDEIKDIKVLSVLLHRLWITYLIEQGFRNEYKKHSGSDIDPFVDEELKGIWHDHMYL